MAWPPPQLGGLGGGCYVSDLTDTGDVRNFTSIKDKRKQTIYNILDDVIVQLKSRFDNFSELSFLGLVDCSKFSKMAQDFNDIKLQSLSEKYAKFFDCIKLKSDLIGLYSSQTVRSECKTPSQLLSFLYQNDLIQTVPEATKLLKLVLTIPATTASVERSFSALKRIKTYNRNRTEEERFSSLATIAIEKERQQKLRLNKEDFYHNVTDIFVQKNRRINFIFK